ncbi:hypothetical protein [Streptomyces montanisoli]|uniref:Sigma-like protein n=1 Tax=Streptomyces montanisoli TaxID=2798581 RepID=A0A940MKE2_9ACTN|nr:hypothetical protein [Streptomyces montanisoli]MBP0461735.1 hypothetical protein [Streptomyces montanisoli]
MSEAKKDEEVTPLDSHIPAPPADGGTTAPATGAETSGQAAATDGDTPIKPLDSHIP